MQVEDTQDPMELDQGQSQFYHLLAITLANGATSELHFPGEKAGDSSTSLPGLLKWCI
jgi:hypothetical protein